jgi:hypothetical protein
MVPLAVVGGWFSAKQVIILLVVVVLLLLIDLGTAVRSSEDGGVQGSVLAGAGGAGVRGGG